MTPEAHQRAKEIFSAVLLWPPSEHEALLGHLSNESPDVLQEVRSLLQYHAPQTLLPDRVPLCGDIVSAAGSPGESPAVSDPAKDIASNIVGRSTGTQTDDVATTRDMQSPRDVATPRAPAARRAIKSGLPFSRSTQRWPRWGPRGQMAWGMIVACLLLGAVGHWTTRVREFAGRGVRSSALSSALNATVRGLELWIEQEILRVEVVANQPDVEMPIVALVEAARSLSQTGGPIRQQLASLPAQQALRQALQDALGTDVRYAVWDRTRMTIADWSPEGQGLGDGVTEYGAALLNRVLDGTPRIQFPGRHPAITQAYPLDELHRPIGILVPIRNPSRQVVACLLVYGIGAEQRFDDLLSLVRIGETGETFAFDRGGTMLSPSRFADQLGPLGLLPAADRSTVLPWVELRDPGRELTTHHPAQEDPAVWPRTKMIRLATIGQDGMDLEGYRSYRGNQVVGAWKWLEPYEIGVATELSMDELKVLKRYLDWDRAALLAMLTISLGTLLASYHALQRLRQRPLTEQAIGQYVLEEKIGEGGMGVVYRARHALLKRPTAMKLLPADKMHHRSVVWFEREAQLASQLTHPNTISIYDYGVTPEGIYYYVMELVDGANLEDLVRAQRPLAIGRVIHYLRQIAGSLQEAHHLGLVHRDIKPRNVMVCSRGGQPDVIKVLDFGLVKSFQPEPVPAGSGSSSPQPSTLLAGTPRYMAPERLLEPNRIDPRADIYAWGAVAFFLVTGVEILSDRELDSLSLWQRIVQDVPPDVRTLRPNDVPAELATLIQRCLAKSPDDRPHSIDEVLASLATLAEYRLTDFGDSMYSTRS